MNDILSSILQIIIKIIDNHMLKCDTNNRRGFELHIKIKLVKFERI